VGSGIGSTETSAAGHPLKRKADRSRGTARVGADTGESYAPCCVGRRASGGGCYFCPVVHRLLPVLALLLCGCESSSGTIGYTPPVIGDDDDVPDDDDAFQIESALVINELMSDNGAAVFDEGGQAGDWIELYNSTDEDIELGGWTLSDDWTNPELHRLGTGLSIEADGHLLLWADTQPDRGAAHLSFSLASAGEAVGLFDPAGEVIQWISFPPVARDSSWARVRDGWADWEEVERVTPGGEN
jgi:hypothetical protein